jgi:hypothetical protein
LLAVCALHKARAECAFSEQKLLLSAAVRKSKPLQLLDKLHLAAPSRHGTHLAKSIVKQLRATGAGGERRQEQTWTQKWTQSIM